MLLPSVFYNPAQVDNLLHTSLVICTYPAVTVLSLPHLSFVFPCLPVPKFLAWMQHGFLLSPEAIHIQRETADTDQHRHPKTGHPFGHLAVLLMSGYL